MNARPHLPPLDPAQRYTVEEAIAYLRSSRFSIYRDVKTGKLPIIKDGRRSYIPGSAIIARSAV